MLQVRTAEHWAESQRLTIIPSLLATAASYLSGVGNIRATVADVTHTVVVSVSLVDVGDSRAVVEKITQA